MTCTCCAFSQKATQITFECALWPARRRLRTTIYYYIIMSARGAEQQVLAWCSQRYSPARAKESCLGLIFDSPVRLHNTRRSQAGKVFAAVCEKWLELNLFSRLLWCLIWYLFEALSELFPETVCNCGLKKCQSELAIFDELTNIRTKQHLCLLEWTIKQIFVIRFISLFREHSVEFKYN